MKKISLPKTKLVYEDGVLLRLGVTNEPVASFKKENIQSIRTVECKEYLAALIVGLTALGFSVISRIYIPSEGWGWAVSLFFLSITGFSFLLIKSKNIEITTKDGTVSYQVADQFEEADGFVISLNEELRQNDVSE